MNASAVAGGMNVVRRTAYGLAIVALVFGGLVGALWLYVTEPWYDDAVIKVFVAQPSNAPWRDDVPGVRSLFPAGMQREAAEKVLAANGFGCTMMVLQGLVLQCTRTKNSLVCKENYLVQLFLDPADRIVDTKASSYAACL